MGATTRFGHLGGSLLTATGVLGLALTGLGDPLVADGTRLLFLEVNPAQNLLHVACGLLLVTGTAGRPSTARTTVLVLSGVLGTLALVGIVTGDPTANPFALTAASSAVHATLAAWGAMAVVRSTVPAPAATPADATVSAP